ncbi:D-Tyr-tRNA(Tyr) deacylase family protein [Mycobacterium xenopi 4042]|uniref:D-Tyr-tRNA(Tyr) deacylase family protein n=1 Tax=Mycobacterium xenopi 4042 TaxID=1299334 RepID=X8BE84_MYCXE|nr:D-Tyr-tRNA(Tyr) deacylase family protein [Mycobacterium xenopi 4042]
MQRVSSASVLVDGQVVGAIRPDKQGLLAFVGVTHSDDIDTTQRLAEKLWRLRILDDEQSAADVNAPILVVSQFTLYADTAKGRRPSWNAAAPRPWPSRWSTRSPVRYSVWAPTWKPAFSVRICRLNWSMTVL